jgi:hypothetical protein
MEVAEVRLKPDTTSIIARRIAINVRCRMAEAILLGLWAAGPVSTPSLAIQTPV